MIRYNLYMMRHYTETALQGAGCPLQSEKSKALSLSGIITEFFLLIWSQCMETQQSLMNLIVVVVDIF